MHARVAVTTGLFLIGAAVLAVGIAAAPPAIIAGVVIMAIGGCLGIMSAISTRRHVMLRPR